jgi:cytochrome P450
LIAQHPSVAAALLDEVSATPAKSRVCADQPEPLSLLDAVVKESMRLLPPVPFQIRRASQDTDLIDCEVKAGTRVFFSAFLTNRLPDVYHDGDKFIPQRWAQIAPSQYEYLVFSAGPRTCIGYWFGMTFLKTTLAHIVRHYRITLVPGARIDSGVAITMWPSRGLPVVIRPQDGLFRASPIRGNIGRLVRC